MSDTPTNDGKNTVLSLKGKSSTVRQSFSHGRSKSVVVETKRKRLLVPQNLETSTQKIDTKITSLTRSDPQTVNSEKSNLSEIEVSRRIKALENAKALETSRIEQEKLSLAAREKELKNLREKKTAKEDSRKTLLKEVEDKTSTSVDQSLAGPLPSEIPLVDAPVTKPRVNKQDDITKKTR
jgi:translation initiation factor IF-2